MGKPGRPKVNRSEGKVVVVEKDILEIFAKCQGRTISEKIRYWINHRIKSENDTYAAQLNEMQKRMKVELQLTGCYARLLGLSMLVVGIKPMYYLYDVSKVTLVEEAPKFEFVKWHTPLKPVDEQHEQWKRRREAEKLGIVAQ